MSRSIDPRAPFIFFTRHPDVDSLWPASMIDALERQGVIASYETRESRLNHGYWDDGKSLDPIVGVLHPSTMPRIQLIDLENRQQETVLLQDVRRVLLSWRPQLRPLVEG